MLKALAVLVAVLGLSAGQLRDVDDISYYNCQGKPDGNYLSPINYMQFITCHNGRASERDCPICHVNAANCPEGRLCFVEEIDACEWVNDPRCKGPVTPTTTTEEPPPTPNPPTPTPEPVDNSTTPNPGSGFCKPAPKTCSPTDDCTGSGCCRSKWFCVRDDSPLGPDFDTHRVVEGTCGKDPITGEQLFFNPNSASWFGGKCDKFASLPGWVKELYRSDKDCIDKCECHPVSKCSSDYTCYKDGENVNLSCGPGEGFDRFEGCTSTCK